MEERGREGALDLSASSFWQSWLRAWQHWNQILQLSNPIPDPSREIPYHAGQPLYTVTQENRIRTINVHDLTSPIHNIH